MISADAVVRALANLPDVEIISGSREAAAPDSSIDAVLHGVVKGRPVCFLLQMKAGGYPRDAQQAIWQFAKFQRSAESRATVPLLVVPSLSKRARELLQEHHISYLDSGGSVYIDLPWAVYLIDRPAPAGRSRTLRNIYRGAPAAVLHTLLLDPGRSWHLSELAQRAEVSVSMVHQVCTHLESQLWMEKQGKGPESIRQLQSPDELLDSWATEHSLARYEARRFHTWGSDPVELWRSISSALAHQDVEHAFTLGSGAQLVAPYGTVTAQAWVLMPSGCEDSLKEVARAVSLREVDEGETITFLLTNERAPMLHRRECEGILVASDVQLYLDLMAWPRRGKEQAQHLRSERMRY